MTDREKMLEILQGLRIKEKIGEGLTMREKFEQIADQLIANGVTVKEPQKPLTVEELKRMDGQPVWYETEATRTPCVVTQSMIDEVDAIFYALGSEKPIFSNVDGYGQTWRCWAEKPTEEERRAAEWER